MVFKELVHQILEKIKAEPYFKWPNKMGGDPAKRKQGLYFQYHQDRGHITEDCRTFRHYVEQLVKVGKLRQFMHQPFGLGSQVVSAYQRESVSRPSLGTICVILATPGRIRGCPSGVMSIARPNTKDLVPESKRRRLEVRPALSFFDEDKVGTYQWHDDALVVTLRIGGYNVRRVLVDQGSGAKIMYPNLYNGLNLKPKDLVMIPFWWDLMGRWSS